MEQDNHLFTGEHFIVLDKRNKQALLRAMLEIEQVLLPEDLQHLQEKRQSLIQGVLGMEREYARFDTVLVSLAERMETLAGSIRHLLAVNGFEQAKSALYDAILPPSRKADLIHEEHFAQWRQEFQGE